MAIIHHVSRQSDHLGLSITMLLGNRRYIDVFYICAINIKSLDKQLKFHWNAMQMKLTSSYRLTYIYCSTWCVGFFDSVWLRY